MEKLQHRPSFHNRKDELWLATNTKLTCSCLISLTVHQRQSGERFFQAHVEAFPSLQHSLPDNKILSNSSCSLSTSLFVDNFSWCDYLSLKRSSWPMRDSFWYDTQRKNIFDLSKYSSKWEALRHARDYPSNTAHLHPQLVIKKHCNFSPI